MTARLNKLLLVALSLVAVVQAADEVFSSPASFSSIAFSSCHKLPAEDGSGQSPMLKAIAAQQPDAFLWTGDAVYSGKKSTLSDLSDSFSALSSFAPYQEFKHSIPKIFGVWDDHDYGRNDSGSETPDKKSRLNLYLDFLGIPLSSPRREREGNYHSVLLGSSPSSKVKVIFLDTRWHRARHFVPSVGGASRLPLAAVLAAFSRLAVSLSSLGSRYGGSMLGEEQWLWLKSELEAGDAKYHVIVSSVQVLTSNPLVESWGHYPLEKGRLLSLLRETNPPNLVLLSGDVHHAELSGLGNLLEATASGMTHSCASPWYGFTCPIMLDSFPSHRINGFYSTEQNYGVLRFHHEEKVPRVSISFHDVSGKVLYALSKAFPPGAKLLTANDIATAPPTICEEPQWKVLGAAVAAAAITVLIAVTLRTHFWVQREEIRRRRVLSALRKKHD